MTTITFGGGPSLEARKNFSNLKDGAQVPGYCGYIHQLKYNNGHTYGEQTHLLGRSKSAANLSQSLSSDFGLKSSLRNQLPKTNGGNRLTESMIPGYTGYIPSRKFDFSDTYKVECDSCIDNFLTNKKEKLEKNSNLMNQVHAQPKYRQISSDQEVKHLLDNYADNHPKSSKLSDKREFTEPPIPGYTGFIPRIVPTDLGLGARYNQTTLKGLNRFKNEFTKNEMIRNNSAAPVGISNDFGNFLEESETSKRLFVKPGMIPKYTGYMHGRKFQFGSTYGNSTRELPVCSHDFKNFGVYLDKYPPKTATC